MTKDLEAAIGAIAPQLIDWRRDFHRHPEVAFQERRTSQIVRAFLDQCGVEVTGHADTGLRGVLRGAASGPTIALRADMDALPMTEENDTPYRSTNDGAMHACGHDGHMAILMGTAKLLTERRHTLAGTVVFLFQPSEELPPGGAKRMVEEGALDGVDRVFGLHLWQPLPTGVVGVRAGALMAQSDNFEITVRGKGGHGAQPHLTVDPVVAASNLVVAAQAIVSRAVDPLEAAVVSFSTIHGGRIYNIIPDEVKLTGTVRTLDARVQSLIKERLQRVAEQTSAAFGASVEFTYEDGYPPVINDPAMVALVERVARRELGDDCVRTIAPSMGGEDFAYYLQKVPGTFFMLGTGDGMPYPHHNARFDIDERALPIGVRLMTSVVFEALQG